MNITELSELSESSQNPKIVITSTTYLDIVTIPMTVIESTFFTSSG